MKSPKMPSPTKSKNPTAPLVNASGLLNEQQERRRQQGIFSTLLGTNSGAGSRLQSYLSSASTTNTAYNQSNSPSTRTRSGMTVKS